MQLSSRRSAAACRCRHCCCCCCCCCARLSAHTMPTCRARKTARLSVRVTDTDSEPSNGHDVLRSESNIDFSHGIEWQCLWFHSALFATSGHQQAVLNPSFFWHFHVGGAYHSSPPAMPWPHHLRIALSWGLGTESKCGTEK